MRNRTSPTYRENFRRRRWVAGQTFFYIDQVLRRRRPNQILHRNYLNFLFRKTHVNQRFSSTVFDEWMKKLARWHLARQIQERLDETVDFRQIFQPVQKSIKQWTVVVCSWYKIGIFRRNATHCISSYAIIVCVCLCFSVCMLRLRSSRKRFETQTYIF